MPLATRVGATQPTTHGTQEGEPQSNHVRPGTRLPREYCRAHGCHLGAIDVAGRAAGVGVSDLPRDVTALPDLLHGRPRAGPVRDRRPVYVDLLPPCNAGCPAGENIQAWLAHAVDGRHEQAWRQLVTDNPLAAIHGRVCYHPCESVCNRADLDSAVSIHSIETVPRRPRAGARLGLRPPARPAAAGGCSSSARGRAGCRLPTTSPGSATRWRSVTLAPSPAG